MRTRVDMRRSMGGVIPGGAMRAGFVSEQLDDPAVLGCGSQALVVCRSGL